MWIMGRFPIFCLVSLTMTPVVANGWQPFICVGRGIDRLAFLSQSCILLGYCSVTN
ncbi:hypothetical protein Ancab_019653 [Ancistrocladus abbreviatus]